jgi:tRNA(Ile)-lysidine synthase
VAHRFDSPEALAGHVARQMAQAVRAGERVCVGYSGGLDSTALLDLLAGLCDRAGFALEAVHVHHGLSPNADRWASSCEDFARRLGVPLRVERVRVARDDPAGLEAAARRARREALARAGAPVVALAHHRDDQAETVLLQALRGTGLKGLAGMAPDYAALGVRWVRPFLEVPRAAIAAYAGSRSLAWVEDESNDSCRIDRNFLRHEGLPVLASRFAQAGGSLARLARHAASAGRLLEALARLDAGGALEPPRLAAAPLRALPPQRVANVLRHWIEAHGGAMPGEARLAQIQRQLLAARNDAQVRIRHEGFLLARHGDFLVLEPASDTPAEWEVAWRGEPVLPLGNALGEVRFEPRGGGGHRREPRAAGPVALLAAPRRRAHPARAGPAHPHPQEPAAGGTGSGMAPGASAAALRGRAPRVGAGHRDLRGLSRAPGRAGSRATLDPRRRAGNGALPLDRRLRPVLE